MESMEEQMQVQTAIAQAVADALNGTEWSRAELFYADVAAVSWWFLDAVDAAGDRVRADPAPELNELLRRLKTSMADPAKGAWISVALTIGRDGRFGFDFNHDRRVYSQPDRRPFDPPDNGEPVDPAEESWLAEFSRFPRRREFLPPWAPPFPLIEIRRQSDERIRELRELTVRHRLAWRRCRRIGTGARCWPPRPTWCRPGWAGRSTRNCSIPGGGSGGRRSWPS